jgi:glutathione S-transferase
MITLYGFGRVFRLVIDETKDLRVQWALEEVGLPYRVHGLNHTGGELDGPAYSEISCFHLVPAIDDDGFTVAESGAVLLYLVEKAGKLIPGDVQGRSRVVQWCFAALNTVEWPLMEISLIDKFGSAGVPSSAEQKWSRRPTAGLMDSSAGWKVATGSHAPTSRSLTSSSPRFCVISARPTSSRHIRV